MQKYYKFLVSHKIHNSTPQTWNLSHWNLIIWDLESNMQDKGYTCTLGAFSILLILFPNCKTYFKGYWRNTQTLPEVVWKSYFEWEKINKVFVQTTISQQFFLTLYRYSDIMQTHRMPRCALMCWTQIFRDPGRIGLLPEQRETTNFGPQNATIKVCDVEKNEVVSEGGYSGVGGNTKS